MRRDSRACVLCVFWCMRAHKSTDHAKELWCLNERLLFDSIAIRLDPTFDFPTSSSEAGNFSDRLKKYDCYQYIFIPSLYDSTRLSTFRLSAPRVGNFSDRLKIYDCYQDIFIPSLCDSTRLSTFRLSARTVGNSPASLKYMIDIKIFLYHRYATRPDFRLSDFPAPRLGISQIALKNRIATSIYLYIPCAKKEVTVWALISPTVVYPPFLSCIRGWRWRVPYFLYRNIVRLD
jgi:hypothetical protein